MGQFIAFIGLAVAAAFSYQMPILLARLFGQEIALNSLWAAAWHDSMTTRIVFLTAYIIVGTALWTAPLVYVGGLLHPHYSQRFRHRTGQVLTLLCYPLLPLFLIVQRRYQASLNEIKNRRALQALYHADFREAFVSFGEFEAYYTRLNDENQIDRQQPVRLAIAACLDEVKDAETLLGLKTSYGIEDLTARYRALAKQVHPDLAGPNDIFRRVTDAREIITRRKGWK